MKKMKLVMCLTAVAVLVATGSGDISILSDPWLGGWD